MISRYTSNGIIGNAEIMEENAKKLQLFFQKLKMDDSNTNSDLTWSIIKQQIEDDVKLLSGGSNTSLFRTTGGKSFEQELSKVLYSIFNQISNGDLLENVDNNLKKINIGQETSNIDIALENLLSNTVQQALRSMGTKTEKYFQENEQHTKKYYLTNIQGKVDVQGYQVQIKGEPNEYLLEIYNLLKDATFSAKNYTEFYWNYSLKAYQWGGSLKLGSSNFFRCFYGVLSDLGYRHPTIMSAFWSSYNNWEQNPLTALRLNQIRFVYELTGAGLLKGGNVKYLIYNDPQTDNIYVQSTAKIIKDHLATDILGYGNPFSGISTIDKDYFY